MLITITSPVGIFNVSDVKPELKATENIFSKHFQMLTEYSMVAEPPNP